MSALRVGAGAVALLAVVAVVITLGGSAFATVVEFDSTPGRIFRIFIGAVLIVFGLRQSQLFEFRMRWLNPVATSAGRMFVSSRVPNQARGDVVYGFGYLLAGFG